MGEYAAGRTPLPCARCNSDLKFATLVDRASGLGAAAVATGHYARVDHDERGYHLRRGLDPGKDQAYFLFSLTQDQIAHAHFPVGGLTKTDVRARARALGLPVADKPDSQEICFVPDNDYAAFVERRVPSLIGEGTIVDRAGTVLGTHGGVHRFTIGQRKGLGLSSPIPLYVVALRPEERQVVVGPREALQARDLVATDVSWVHASPSAPRAVQAQIRHRHPAAPALVTPLPGRRAKVVFDEPQIAITPGQAVVWFDGDEVLGGGWIRGA